MNILEEYRVDTEGAMECGTEYEQPELLGTKLRIAPTSDMDIEWLSGYWAQEYPSLGEEDEDCCHQILYIQQGVAVGPEEEVQKEVDPCQP